MFTILDRHVLRQVSLPLLSALVIGLLMLLADRMVSLLDTTLGKKNSFAVVFEMLAYLVPHYLGTAIPAALFGLGGVLIRYRPDGDRMTIAMICAVSLILHPGVVYVLARFVFGLDTTGLRSAVMTAAMAPGVNAYMFASLYGVAMRVAASSVLVATALSILTVWGWLQILP